MTLDTPTETPACAVCGSPLLGGAAPGGCAACRSTSSTTERNPIRGYFDDLWEIITHPSRFFARMPLSGSVSAPLAFALVTHWLGSALAFLWKGLVTGIAEQSLRDVFSVAGDIADVNHPGRSAALAEAGAKFTHWIWGTGSVILDPFITAASILFTSLLVFVGTRMLVVPGRHGAPERIEYETSLRLVCYGMSPAILAAVPLVGGAVSSIAVVIVTVIGAREVYKTSVGKAIVIALFPKLLFLAILSLVIAAIGLALFKAVAMLV